MQSRSAANDLTPLSEQIWDMKYRLKTREGAPIDGTLEATWQRVARALAAPERERDRTQWAEQFEDTLRDFQFLPAGRILAGAGTDRRVTLFNCFVMGQLPDDLGGIFDGLREAALTMQQGGGIGYDFSTLRPKGAPVQGVGADASGPLSFMDVWDSMCRTIMSAGSRRGAMMGVMRCDHPDIEAFIAVKKDPARLRMFNLSVLVTDAFIEAVKQDAVWPLRFGETTYRTVQARELWDQIMQATYDVAEPGVIFIDRINRQNNLAYCEEIGATNPCGEQPLPPYGACLLGSINLMSLVENPFSDKAGLDEARLTRVTTTAVRLMDNVIDVSRFPLQAQAHEAQAKRRIGLGVTGLADALICLGVRYGSEQSLALIDRWMGALSRAAYRASVALAREKGAFPLCEADELLKAPLIKRLPGDIQEGIAKHGLRNALLTSIAPTGTISLFANNVSSGIEPVFSFTYKRSVLQPDGTRVESTVSDPAYRLFRERFGEHADLPDSFVSAQTLSPRDHVAVQAAAQVHIDSSISKTINCPEDISFEDFKSVYMAAFDAGCKGCTTYRPNAVTGSVLTAEAEPKPATEDIASKTDQEPTEAVSASQEETLDPAAAQALQAGLKGSSGEDGVVFLTQPLARPQSLPGSTYKVRWPDSDHAIYITINDIVQDGRRRPFEIFINSKNMEHYAWTVALTRMISAVFRRGGDVTFVVEELKAVFDPRGGQWMKGRYVPSLLAAIGDVIENHMIETGFLTREQVALEQKRLTPSAADAPATPSPSTLPPASTGLSAPFTQTSLDADETDGDKLPKGKGCPKCGMPTLFRVEGCDQCFSCGYSKCG